jgi:hypothetical protein
MADELRDLWNQQPGLLSALNDPMTLKSPASWAAYNELGGAGESGGDTDALRHLLGAAALTKRQGSTYANAALNWHENPMIPTFLGGGYGQREEDRAMDLYNNQLGIEIGQKAKSYDEALALAKQAIKERKAKVANTNYNKAEVKQPAYDPIDAALDKPAQLVEWAKKYFAK